MNELKITKITLISNSQKRAAQFRFSKKYNLIVSQGENSVGKSSLVKSIFWCLGCEPSFDDSWGTLNVRGVLDFEIGDKPYQIARHSNNFYFKENDGPVITIQGTGNLSSKLASILNFNALLAERDKDSVITPSPAYYFVPFYIDQKQSWANAWSSFEKLYQFQDWKKVIIPYLTGMISKSYFDTTEIIYTKRQAKKEITKDIEKLDTAISVVSSFPALEGVAFDEEELSDIEDELKVDVANLNLKQEILYEELATLRAERAHKQSQLALAKESLEQADSDFEFAESLPEEIECPTCGVIHDNSLANRFSLFQDKEQALQLINRLERELEEVESKLATKNSEFEGVRNEIERLDKKYSSKEGQEYTLSSVLDAVASHSVKKKVESNRSAKIEEVHNLNTEEEGLTKSRTKDSKESRKIVREAFQLIFPKYLAKLKAFGVNGASVKSPENHAKVSKSGGAAESTRAMLAYYLSTYNLIANYGETVLSPLVIDTPNQHEQAAKHYDSIVKLLMEEFPEKSQLFICGMDSPKLDPLRKNAKVIILDNERSLLQPDAFQTLDANYSHLFEGEDEV